jgi:membrane-associated protein
MCSVGLVQNLLLYFQDKCFVQIFGSVKDFSKKLVKPLFSLVFFNISNFAPIVAGIVSMDKQKFMFYNILSSFIWSFTLIFAGHYLVWLLLENYQIDLKNIELIVIALVHNSFTSNLQV